MEEGEEKMILLQSVSSDDFTETLDCGPNKKPVVADHNRLEFHMFDLKRDKLHIDCFPPLTCCLLPSHYQKLEVVGHKAYLLGGREPCEYGQRTIDITQKDPKLCHHFYTGAARLNLPGDFKRGLAASEESQDGITVCKENWDGERVTVGIRHAKTASEKTSNGKAISEKTSIGNSTSEGTLNDKATSEKTSNGKATSVRTSNGMITSEKTSNGKATSVRTSIGNTISKKTSNNKANSEKTSNGKATSEKTSNGKATSEKTSNAKATSEKTSNAKATSEKTSNAKATSVKTSNAKATSEKTSNRKATSARTSPSRNQETYAHCLGSPEDSKSGLAASESSQHGRIVIKHVWGDIFINEIRQQDGKVTMEIQSVRDGVVTKEILYVRDGIVTTKGIQYVQDVVETTEIFFVNTASKKTSKGKSNSKATSYSKTTREKTSNGKATSEGTSYGKTTCEKTSNGQATSVRTSNGKTTCEKASNGKATSEKTSVATTSPRTSAPRNKKTSLRTSNGKTTSEDSQDGKSTSEKTQWVPMPVGDRWYPIFSSLDGVLYNFGQKLCEAEFLNPSSDKWEPLPVTKRVRVRSVSDPALPDPHNKQILIHSPARGNQEESHLYAFCPEKRHDQKWKCLSTDFPKWSDCAAVVDGVIYLGTDAWELLEAYDTCTGSWLNVKWSSPPLVKTTDMRENLVRFRDLVLVADRLLCFVGFSSGRESATGSTTLCVFLKFKVERNGDTVILSPEPCLFYEVPCTTRPLTVLPF